MSSGPANPAGMGFTAQETDLLTTTAAQRDCNFNAARIWKVCHAAPVASAGGKRGCQRRLSWCAGAGSPPPPPHPSPPRRALQIKNPAHINPMSQSPVAYKLMPMPSPPLMATPDSLVASRAVFARHNLWVTPYSDSQVRRSCSRQGPLGGGYRGVSSHQIVSR
jgi:Cu2+-containing amine oxidase